MQGVPSNASCVNGVSSSSNSSSAAEIALHELQYGEQQQQIQNPSIQVHDDFFDQISSWTEFANPKSPWDLTKHNPNSSDSASSADASNGQKHFSIALAGKATQDSYDESSLLASRLRQHQITGGISPAGKPMLLQLNHQQLQHDTSQHLHQNQQMILPAMSISTAMAGGRCIGGGDLGLLSLPLTLGSGGSSDSRLLVERSRDEVDASFKSPNSSGGEGLYNGFGGSLQHTGQVTNQQHFHQPPQGGSMPSQNYEVGHAGIGQAAAPPAAAAAAGGGSAPPRQRVRARRGQATDPHSIAERLRRERIAERMKGLQELVPNANKTDKASMLDEIIDYLKFLQLQVKVLSMSRLGGAAAVTPLVTDISPEGATTERGGINRTAANDSLTVTEQKVAKLMEEDMGSAMQYLQGKGLCLMPISLASAISNATANPRSGGAVYGGGGLLSGKNDGPSSPSMSALTLQSSTGNAVDGDVSRSSVKDSASVSKS